jgi:chromosome segregation ATPase
MEPIEVLEETTEYIKKTDLDAYLGKIVSSLQPRIELAVEQAVQKAIDKISTNTDEKIATVKGEIRGEFEQKLSQHTEDERKLRQSEMDSLRGQVKNIGDDTRSQLGEFNSTVNAATKAVADAQQKIELFTSKIEGWNIVLSSTRQQYEDTRHDIEQLEAQSDNTTKAQVAQAEQLKTLTRTISGGEGDGLSILGELKAIRSITDTSLGLVRNVSDRQDKSDHERQQEKERWAKPAKALAGLTKEAAKTPYFWFAVIFALLVVVSIFSPATLIPLIEFAQSFFRAP